jgi:DNA-binding transcriptional ArsR family regulator
LQRSEEIILAVTKGAREKGPARQKRKKVGIDERLVKSLTHGLRVEILTILNERIASPNELSKELGEGLSQVSYHVKVLKDYGCIELVKTEPRRGAVEHYYRATARAWLTDRDWERIPASVRPGMSADLLELILGDAVSALEEGTLDSRIDRHMSRTPLILDEEGWKEVTETLSEALGEIAEIQNRSSRRLAKSEDGGFSASVSLLGFEVPEGHRRRSKKSKRA